MQMKYISVIATVAILSVGSLADAASFFSSTELRNQAIAQNSHPIPPRQQEQDREKAMQQDLNLTPEQQKQIQTIRSQNYDKIAQKQEEFRTNQEKLKEMMAGSYSAAELRTQYEKVLTLSQELARLNFDSIVQILAVLNDEQRVKFAQMFNINK